MLLQSLIVYQDQKHTLSYDAILSQDIPEHHRFIVCLTYKMARWRELAQNLLLTVSDIESIESNHRESCSEGAYQAVILWAARNMDTALLSTLLVALQSCNMSIKLSTECAKYKEKAHKRLHGFERVEVGEAFVTKMAVRLGPVWKPMGRLLGLSVFDIEKISYTAKTTEPETIDDIVCNMLHRWKMVKGKCATYRCFIQALVVVLDLDTAILNDAWRTALDDLELLNSQCTIFS